MASVRKREWTHNGETKTAWVVAYTDGGGKRRLKTFEKKKGADAYRLKTENEIKGRTHIPGSQSRTVKLAVQEYIEHMTVRNEEARGVGGLHLRGIQYTFKSWVTPFIGNKKVCDLTFVDIETCVTAMREKGLNKTTVRNHLRVIKAFQEWCIRREYLAINVTSRVIADLGNMESDKVATFTKEQVRRLIASAEHRPPYKSVYHFHLIKVAIHLAAFCALRIGEIAGLTIEAIDFENSRIEVRQALTPMNEIKAPKSKSGIRNVPLPSHVADLLKAWIADNYVPNDRHLLFVKGDPGKKQLFNMFAFYRHWYDVQNRAGLPRLPNRKRGRTHYHFHALRHFAISLWHEAALPVTVIAKLAGHSHYNITMQVYSHALLEEDPQARAIQEAAARLVPLKTISSTRQESDMVI